MTKTELKEKAKDILQDTVAIAYYKLEGFGYEDLTEEERDMVSEYIDKYGKVMCKAIKRKYVTY